MNALRKPSVAWSLALFAAAFVADRLHKVLQVDLAGWTGGEVIRVTPFFDYVLVWNYGISYGLLDGLGPQFLLIVMGLAMIALAWWWWTDESFWTRAGIAFAIGGALSNAIDRMVYGAVADFFHFYVGNFSWYVFNIADVAISAGVLILIVDVLRPKPKPQPDPGED